MLSNRELVVQHVRQLNINLRLCGGLTYRCQFSRTRKKDPPESAKAKDPSEPAKLEVSFFENSPPAPYWVLSTDYDSYSLVYSCTDLGLLHVDFAWIMSREPTLPEQTAEDLRGALAFIGVRVDKMISTKQDEAFCSPMYQ